MGPVCILHLGELRQKGEIKLFINNMNSWDEVLSVKEKRLKSLKYIKYTDMSSAMPDVFHKDHCYHTLCYKN